MKTEPKTIQKRGLSEPDAEVLAAVLTEDEDEIRQCPYDDCGDCPHDKINTCFN